MSNVLNRTLNYAAFSLLLAACAAPDQALKPPSAATAETESVQSSSIPEVRITTGTVRSSTVSPISAKLLGNVTRVLVSEGDRVRRADEGRGRTGSARVCDIE